MARAKSALYHARGSIRGEQNRRGWAGTAENADCL